MSDTENSVNPEVNVAAAIAKDAAGETRRPRGKRRAGGSGGGGERGERGGGERGEGRRERGGDKGERPESDMVEKLVGINRVAKVVKGGKRFGFAAIVVVGDGKGRVGYGTGKAREVPDAVRKATDDARRSMVRIQLREGRTLHHDVKGHYGAGTVVLRTAPAGTGIIAGGPMRAIFEAVGISDVVAKSVGTSNPHNMIKATFDALQNMVSPRSVASRRGKKVGDILGKRGAEYAQASEG